MQLGADAQTLEQAGRVTLCLPAAQLGELRLQIGGPQAVVVGKVRLFVDGVLLLHHVVQVLVAHDDGIHNGVGVIGVLVLLQHGHPLGGVDGDGAVGGVQLPGEDPQERGFPRPVGSDDAIAVAGQELKIHMLKQPLSPKLHSQIADCDH